MQARPLHVHLQRYPQLQKLILDSFGHILPSEIVALNVISDPQSTDVGSEKEHLGVRHLHIRMPDQKVLPDEQASLLLSCAIQMVHLPNLQEISIAMLVSDEWTHYKKDLEEAHSWKEVIPRLDVIAGLGQN